MPRPSLDQGQAPEADGRNERGHFETDTIVSCLDGMGGFLVVIDRVTREYFIKLVVSISQEAIFEAHRRMKARDVFDGIRSMSTDNGSEFLDADAIAKVLGCKVYCMRAFWSPSNRQGPVPLSPVPLPKRVCPLSRTTLRPWISSESDVKTISYPRSFHTVSNLPSHVSGNRPPRSWTKGGIWKDSFQKRAH